jgi:hypothetical protein
MPVARDPVHALRAGLRAVTYGDTGLTLHLELTNEGSRPVRADGGAALFRLEALAYAPHHAPAPVTILAGGRARLDLRYELGRPLLQPGRLSLEGLSREEAPLPALWLDVPPRANAPSQSGKAP